MIAKIEKTKITTFAHLKNTQIAQQTAKTNQKQTRKTNKSKNNLSL